MTQISVFRTSEQELNAWLTSAVPRNSSRSGGLICYTQIEPMWFRDRRNQKYPWPRAMRNNGQKRRTFRDN